MSSKKMGQISFNICKYTFFNIWKRWSAKIWTRFFLRFVSILFLIFEKGINKKLGYVLFKIRKYIFFNIWKRWQAKDWARFIFRFVSTLFLIFEIGITKNWARYFRIFKYTVSIYLKSRSARNSAEFVEDLQVYSLYILKRVISKKLCEGFLRFISILFLVFKKCDQQKIGLDFPEDL